jgi:hypothetical protein
LAKWTRRADGFPQRTQAPASFVPSNVITRTVALVSSWIAVSQLVSPHQFRSERGQLILQADGPTFVELDF